jgi:hypothetical protein
MDGPDRKTLSAEGWWRQEYEGLFKWIKKQIYFSEKKSTP